MSKRSPVSIALFRLIERADWEFCSDYFCWKKGGDGDNGEILMDALDALLAHDPAALDDLRVAVREPS